ncbi:MAG: nuclear transport factor 2 family protein [Bacteroidales bacterium]
MRHFGFLIITIVVLSTVGCTHHQNLEADQAALEKLSVGDWDENANAGNLDALADSYTADAIRIGDGMVLNGREEMRDAFKTYWSSDVPDVLDNTVEEIRVSGDLATVRGFFEASNNTEDGGRTIVAKGAWIDICERQESGEWKLVATIATDIGEGNKLVSARYHELDPGNMDEILTEDFIGRNEKSRMTWTLEQHKNFWSSNTVDAKDVIYRQIAEGDWVATWFKRTWIQDGNPLEYEMMHFKRFENGKIAELWEYGDSRQVDED